MLRWKDESSCVRYYVITVAERQFHVVWSGSLIRIDVSHTMLPSYVEIKCQLAATEVFIADLIDCSTCFGHHYAHHQELKSIIQCLLRVVFRAVVFKLLVWCEAEGS